ncbi:MULTISPECIES: oligosaccharide flippase family protein [Actinoalloteichus]|uniref:Membrane protein n=1 Tax=Actinoalloteichus fjordicus TaxID=1612552 RepID=A0AAC9PV35_9PSEU|nr:MULTISPECIES: oligosaccharide flippase family protein [Actinoalloteichus]APU17752.1 putative membrane protein [Actinoalloteichus fjordicus]APU23830.1 putative membrane protein [Actinoalloteichus sp. GBA129-24]
MTAQARGRPSARSGSGGSGRAAEKPGRDAGSLGGRFRRGLRLSLLNTVLSRAGTFALGVLLARVFVPEQFGVYAAALVVQQLLLTVNDLGAAAALVRRPETAAAGGAGEVAAGGAVRADAGSPGAGPGAFLPSATGSPAASSPSLPLTEPGPAADRPSPAGLPTVLRTVSGQIAAGDRPAGGPAAAAADPDPAGRTSRGEPIRVDSADGIDAMLPTAWTLSVLWGAVGAVICLAGAGGLADLLGSPAATDLIRVMAVTLLLDGFASVPAAMLTRELRQARRLVADVSGMAVNLTLTALLALGGLGPWALVIGNVTGTALTAVLVMGLARVWPRFGFDRRYGAEITRCGATMLGASILLVVVQATPQAVTGSLLGASTLGFFYLASNMANWPAVLVSATVERVALATFSRARDAGRDLSHAVSTVLGLVCAVVLPGGVALAVLAEPLIQVVYGSRWSLAAAALSGLALAAVARVVAELVFSLLIAVDAMSSSVLLLACWAAASVPATIWAAGVWGLPGVAWAQAAVALLVALPVHLLALRRARVSLLTVVGGAAVPLFSALGCGALLLGLRGLALPAVIELAVGGLVVGAVVFAGVLRAQRRVGAALGDVDPAGGGPLHGDPLHGDPLGGDTVITDAATDTMAVGAPAETGSANAPRSDAVQGDAAR